MILSLETATSVCSVALHDQGRLKGHAFNAREQTASAELAVMIRNVLRESGVHQRQLKAVAVSSGPGSFTGLRIGVATAKGLCFSLGIPLISINTLLILSGAAFSRVDGEPIFCPMIDARRMEVYCLLVDRRLNVTKPTQALVVDETSFAEELKTGRVVFFGNGAAKCQVVIRSSNAVFLEDVALDAANMGSLALEKFDSQRFEDVPDFEPFYLKDFVAKKPKSLI